MLWNLIIFPVASVIELAFMLGERLFNPGAALIVVSAVVSLGTLPLYLAAEKWQQVERAIQKRVAPAAARVKAVFRGDERYMILATLYRQNHYHPAYALRGSAGLLIQIPFFIAAYTYLSQQEMLRGRRFLFIADLGAPDGLLRLGGLAINVLPIAMTLINCAAGAVYTRGFSLREKIQIYGMAAVFLALLYDSPAGLVFYWTMNNVFSLVKNCLQKTRYGKRIAFIALCAAAACIDVYALAFVDFGYFYKRVLVAAAASTVFLVPLFRLAYRRLAAWLSTADGGGGRDQPIFWMAAASLWLLAGAAIPGALIASSTQEFSFIGALSSPFPFIARTAEQAAGIFLIWIPCLYLLFSREGGAKHWFAAAASSLCAAALINCYVFPGSHGFLTTSLVFSNPGFRAGAGAVLLQAGALLAALIVPFWLRARKPAVLVTAQAIILVTLIGFSAYNLVKIRRDFAAYQARVEAGGNIADNEPVYALSSTGKNVVVIMLDRAISGFVPYIFAEKPELEQKFRGFVWYPNCVSFGNHTLFGVPPVFGGYDYTPGKMARPSDIPLVERHNEALLTLPKLFFDNGFSVTVTDPSWANYSYKPDLRVFDGYPGMRVENIIGRYTGSWLKEHPDSGALPVDRFLLDNLWRFSVFKMAPPFSRTFFYDDGKWLVKINDSGGGTPLITIDQYAALAALPGITEVRGGGDGGEGDQSTFTLIVNELTHEPALFKRPEYEPSAVPAGGGGDHDRDRDHDHDQKFADDDSYHANMAALLLLGAWFDFLSAHNAYDNTRIIITADHGGNNRSDFPGNITLPNGECVETYNPLFLVKDFCKDGGLVTDHTFMTNADTPWLAVDGVIENPANPFTGSPIKPDKERGVTITVSDGWSPDFHAKTHFTIKPNEWLRVHDNIFEPANWTPVDAVDAGDQGRR